MTRETPRTPISFSSIFMTLLLSKKDLASLFDVANSEVLTLSILMVLSSRGSRLTILASPESVHIAADEVNEGVVYISREKRVHCKCSSLAFIIGSQHNEHIFDTNHKRKCPNDERQNTEEVIMTGLGSEGGGIDVER